MFSMKFLLLQTLRLASQATSLYTREAHYRPTVHLKGVTHYTLQGKACEKEYEQMPVLLLFFRQVKPALWNAPLRARFLLSLLSSHFSLKKACKRNFRLFARTTFLPLQAGYTIDSSFRRSASISSPLSP